MATKNQSDLATELRAALLKKFPGIEVEVGESERWKRPCLTFRWDGFKELLPEERFHRLVTMLPPELRDITMSGFIWLELAPGESVDAFLKLPRSEDIAARERDIFDGLRKAGFIDSLAKAMGANPQKTCEGDFSRAIKTLKAAKQTEAGIRDARLVFIRHGAYCDCQALESVWPTLEKRYAGAK
jgi:hypothetical protein